MKTEPEIYAVLTDIFQELFGDGGIVLLADTTAEDIEGWDSFNHMNIIVATEVEFGIKMDFDEIEGLQRVGDLVAIVMKKLGAA